MGRDTKLSPLWLPGGEWVPHEPPRRAQEFKTFV